MSTSPISRRTALAGLVAAVATPAAVRAQTIDAVPEDTRPDAVTGNVITRHNISSFETQDWHAHFETLGVGAMLADISSRALHYWGPDGTYFLFPSSVPRSKELTRRGYATIVRKTENPPWTPTANMRKEDPSLPEHIAGGAPGNPLGTRAMYLSWPAYLVHGTHDTRKIGRMSSSGCIGLYNEHVEKLYPLVQIGTQVRVL